MDDLTVGGPKETVAKDVQLIMKAGQDVGLNLNISKCELVSNPGCHITDPVLSCLPQVPTTKAELLVHSSFLAQLWTAPGQGDVTSWPEQWTDWHSSVHRMPLFF